MSRFGQNNELRRLSIAAYFLIILVVSAFAQAQPGGAQPQSQKGAVLKGKAPVSKEVLKVKFPKPVEARLANGLRVYILENHSLPLFAAQMVVLSGGLTDKANQVGVAQSTAQLLTEGTKKRSSKDIAEQIDRLGASLSAGASLSGPVTTISASGLIENLEQILDLYSDVILNPTFPAEEFGKLKSRALASLRASRAQPSYLAREKYSQLMYAGHPAGRIAVSAEDWERLTPEVLKEFHDARFAPNNSMLAISGDVDPKRLLPLLEKYFGNWKAVNLPAAGIPAAPTGGPALITLIDRPGSVQTNLLAGVHSIERNDPDYPALQVMNMIVGGGAASRLFLNLREDKGYTYGAYSQVSAFKYRGTFTANTEVRTDVTDGSMKELIYELNRIRNEKVLETELENAKRSIVGEFALQFESPQALLGNFITTRIYELGDNYWNDYPARIVALTSDDIQRIARKYLDLGHLQIVAVGDGKKIIDALRKYGKVDVFDSEGKAKDLNAPAPKASSTASSGGIAGDWDLQLKTPDGNEVPLKATITWDGTKLGGSIESMMGPLAISSGTVRGDDVEFKASGEAQGQKVDLVFNGKATPGQLKGMLTIQGAPIPPMEVSGVRAK